MWASTMLNDTPRASVSLIYDALLPFKDLEWKYHHEHEIARFVELYEDEDWQPVECFQRNL